MYTINQPDEDLLSHIERLLNENFTHLTIVVAYAKRSGVALLRDSILNFKQNGGYIKAIIGIDQRNTSIEALRDLLSLCDEVFVFHCEDISQTFHPKLYYFTRENDIAEIILGSSNLTNGGLQRNTELNIGKRFQYSSPVDNVHILNINSIIDSYLQDGDLCKVLTPELIEILIQKDYILTEQRINQSIRSHASRAPLDRIFGRGRNLTGLRRTLPIFQILPPEIVPVESVVNNAEEIITTGRKFWKKLSNNDVSHTSSPGQIQIPIQYYNYLPVFVNQETKPNGARQEECFFDLLFIDSLNNQIPVLNARAIYYAPAPTHPRPNPEIRFTFRNRDVLNLLEAGDKLVFEDTLMIGYSFIVRQVKVTDSTYVLYPGRWGSID
jgi:HKD family nuclease